MQTRIRMNTCFLFVLQKPLVKGVPEFAFYSLTHICALIIQTYYERQEERTTFASI